jgi:gas vesicle protein
MLQDGLVLLAGLGAGLAAMYLFDPESGPQRRRQVSRAAGAALETAGEKLGTTWNQVSSAASDATSSARDRLSRLGEQTSDVSSQLLSGARQMLPEREPEHHYIGQSVCALGSLLLGAGMTYLLDPDQGSDRRARIGSMARGAVTSTADFFVCAARWAGDRMGMRQDEPLASAEYGTPPTSVAGATFTRSDQTFVPPTA